MKVKAKVVPAKVLLINCPIVSDRYPTAGTGRSAGGHYPYALDADVNSCSLVFENPSRD
jgi:hypothetical protein